MPAVKAACPTLSAFYNRHNPMDEPSPLSRNRKLLILATSLIFAASCFLGGVYVGATDAQMQRLPFDLASNLRLLTTYPAMKEDTGGLPKEMLYSCLIYYQDCKKSWFKRRYLSVIRKREPALDARLLRAKEALKDYQIIDLRESRPDKVVVKTGEEWFRDLSIP